MDLSIVIVNWNSADYVEECIASIEQHTTGLTYEVIIVDNASATGEVERLRRSCPRSIVIKSDENLGFARANNIGFRNSTGEYILFLNPDTKLISPAFSSMLASIKALPDAGIVGCKLLNSNLSIQLSSIQKCPTILNQVLDAEYLLLRWPHCPLWTIAPLFSDNVEPVKVDVISGACMLLKRAVFERLGMFSEEYFMYAEDLDLNYKVKNAGLSNYYLGGAAIIHHGGRSSTRQKDSQWSIVMKHKAMCQLFRKIRGRPYEGVYRAAISCSAMGRLLILAVMFPFGDKEWIKCSAAKWKTILKSMLGLHGLAENRPIA